MAIIEKKKPMKRNKCGELGHRRTSKKFSFYNDETEDEEENEHQVEGDESQDELVYDNLEVDQSEAGGDETQDDTTTDIDDDSDDTDITIINVDENNECITS